MGRSLDAVIGSLPKVRRDRIDARYQALKKEVESLQALRKAAGKAQVDIASSLRISQPSVSKMEKQADMYLSTLRNYIAAIGGDLELVVRFPQQAPIHLNGLGEMFEPVATGQGARRGGRARVAKPAAAHRGKRRA
jgi:transcriptional regulator with XRE-family HTH domain